VHRLPVLKSHHPERAVLGFRHQAPQGEAAIGLAALLQWIGQHALNPGFLDAEMIAAHHIAKITPQLSLSGQQPITRIAVGLAIATGLDRIELPDRQPQQGSGSPAPAGGAAEPEQEV
jgi:hypothetical protein